MACFGNWELECCIWQILVIAWELECCIWDILVIENWNAAAITMVIKYGKNSLLVLSDNYQLVMKSCPRDRPLKMVNPHPLPSFSQVVQLIGSTEPPPELLTQLQWSRHSLYMCCHKSIPCVPTAVFYWNSMSCHLLHL